jgi:hypothetical protein
LGENGEVPRQALFFMNSPLVKEASVAFARRLLTVESDDAGRQGRALPGPYLTMLRAAMLQVAAGLSRNNEAANIVEASPNMVRSPFRLK